MTTELSNAARERQEAQKALANGELHDRDTYTAKQVAYRCGTDAKTMRKFFRSNYSTVEPVGQGGRYEFDARDLPKIKREFDRWLNRASVKNRVELTTKPSPTPKSSPKLDPEKEIAELKRVVNGMANAIQQAIDEEPTEEELMEIADLELDDEEWED